jgi:ATP-dependent Lon protease
LIQIIKLNPEEFIFRSKLLQLTRVIPFVENNYKLIELNPKGTVKSHVFQELLPHGILISDQNHAFSNWIFQTSLN